MAVYRAYRRAADDGSQALAAERTLRELAAKHEWQGPVPATASPGTMINAWLGATRQFVVDIEVPWKQRNVQALAVVSRAMAEHVGLGTLMFRATYGGADESGAPLGLADVTAVSEPLRVMRDRMSAFLHAEGRRYNDLTVLSGFAHPGRFGMQVYLSARLDRTGDIRISNSLTHAHGPFAGAAAARVCMLACLLLTVGESYATAT